ncbi:hypothetical protein FJ941_08545 [Mesorhizobium sp. B2-3-13]|uniref:hypothetical protein n=1 Tax=Mesorhizobium sp. B2-3-13 TaxID=2589951 RepID=UPI00112BDF0A|nr:hypothetical protein [Mesorhizobium sp. B2-3-13]TPL85372.1 hypothetical protein FJ941_08545 [Mesorhizobium sp. B2-3-13]
MVDRKNREDWKRERSLLALGEALRGEDDASLVSIGDRADPSWREDAATRHRLARSRRETKASPPQSVAGEASRFPPDEEQPFEADDAWRSRGQIGTSDLPPDLPRARLAPEEPPAAGRAHDATGSRATGRAGPSSNGGTDESPGRIGALISRLRKAMSRKPWAEADDLSSEFGLPAFADNGRPPNVPIFPTYPKPGFGPRQAAGLDYSQSPFQPGPEAGYGRQMASPSRSPLMPQWGLHPAPPLPSSPYAQPMGYPPAQPWSQAGHTQATAGPYAAQMPYPPSPAPTQPPAAPHARPIPVKEGGEQPSVEEIRASLREFHEAVRELTESRTRRRYF